MLEVRGLHERQFEGELASMTGAIAMDGNLTFVGIDQVPHEGQPDAETPSDRAGLPHEWIENTVEHVPADADARIAHHDNGSSVLHSRGD